MAALPARRKRRPKMCPNPLFVKWVEELRDQAKENGSKSQYSYTKALNSLKKYPLPLSSGQEAKLLDHVGEKVAKMLDKRLAEHNSNKGDSPTGAGSSSHGGVRGSARPRKGAGLATSSSASAPTSPPLPISGSTSTSPPVRKRSPDGKLVGPEEGSAGPSKLKKKRVPQEYIPVYRSGPYAILVALYNVEQRPGYRGYLTKAELITEAQPHCDASFTIPDPGSYYTTWSSMSSLVERGFVRRVKHPPRFSLTDAGVSLALRLIEGGAPSLSSQGQTTSSQLPLTKGRVSTPTNQRKRRKSPSPSPLLAPSPPPLLRDHSPIVLGSSSSPSPAVSNTTKPYDLEDCDPMEWDSDHHWSRDGTSGRGRTPNVSEGVHHYKPGVGTPSPGLSSGLSPSLSSGSSAPAPTFLQFWYVNTDNKCVRSKDCAAVTFNDEISVGFLIKCHKTLLEDSGVRYTTDPSRKADGPFLFVYLSNDDAPDRCSPPEEGGAADRQGGGGRSTSPPATSTRTHHLPGHSTAPRTAAPQAVQTATGLRSVSPITLSDSDESDSDVEVVPLAERIGLRGLSGDRGAGRGSRSEITGTRASPTGSDAVQSGCVGSTGLDPRDRRSSIDCDRYGTSSTPHQGLSPGQAAGLAALRRLQATCRQSAGSGSGTNTPVSAGGTHTGVCDLTGESCSEDSNSSGSDQDAGATCRPTKKICSEKRWPSPPLQQPVPTTHSHRSATQDASRTGSQSSDDSSVPHRLSGSGRSGNSVSGSASVDSSRCGTSSASVDSSRRGTSSASVDSSRHCTSSASVDSSRRGTSSASVDSSRHCTSSASVDSSRRDTSSASVDSSRHCTSSASVDSSRRDTSSASVDSSRRDTSSASVDSSRRGTSSASVDSSRRGTSSASVDSSHRGTSSASVDSSRRGTSSASVDSSHRGTSSASVDSSRRGTSSASVDSSHRGTSSASVDSSRRGTSSASVDSSRRGTSSASVDSSRRDTSSASVDSSHRGTSSASVDSSRRCTSSASVDSSRCGTSSASTSRTAASLLSSAPSKASPRLVAVEAIDLSNPEFVLRPGSFEVILCVDSSESTASRNSKAHFRGLLLQELGKNGVKYDVRRMHVGDFVWIAKESVALRPGELGVPPSREVVLEYIVERKRMDDLAGSIIDGRFLEQKFRLTNCGVRNPVYLVEEYGEVNHAKLGERALEQAVANTQIIDGFFVKRTKDIRESVAYLTIMTRYLQNHYSGKTIKAYPCDKVVQLKNMSTQNEDVCSMTFEQFNSASIKSKPLTVYEMFGRHLIQIPQSSADKAFAILEKYPTISHLREAYRHCETEKERENLLRDIKVGPNQRNLGPNLSSLICSLYWKGQ